MNRMFVTACPACATRFRITDAQLEAAGGQVRCGACLDVFDALPNIEPQEHGSTVDAVTTAPIVDAAAADGDTARDARYAVEDAKAASPADESASFKPGATTSPASNGAPSGSPALRFTVVGAGPLPVTHDRSLLHSGPPSEIVGEDGALSRRRRSVLDVDTDAGPLLPEERRRLAQLGVEWEARPAPRRLRIVVPLVVALVLLLAQYLYFRADSVASNVTLRPWFEGLCAVVGCAVPAFRDPALLHSGSVVMRPHPQRPDVLLIDAQILNEAPYPQPFPDVSVDILDRTGAILSSRIFTPMDYRRGELATMPLVPPHRPLQVSLQMLKPNNASVNFRFELQPASN